MASWTVDLLNLAGTLQVADVPIQGATLVWDLDAGGGTFDADLPAAPASTTWLNGQRRILARDGAGVAKWGGYLTRVKLSGRPGAQRWAVSGLTLASALRRRVVIGDFSRVATVASTIARDLLTHAQAQTNGGMGFTLGSVTGTAIARTRDFCDGDNIWEAIQELADHEPNGLDWEIDQNGALNIWATARGSASGLTLDQATANSWEVEEETSDLATGVVALGSTDEPCGSPLVYRSGTWAGATQALYGRRDVAIDQDTTDTTTLNAKGDAELLRRARARVRVTARYLHDAGAPFAFGALWLGDRATVNLPTVLGGNQTMRVIQVKAILERVDELWVDYKLELD